MRVLLKIVLRSSQLSFVCCVMYFSANLQAAPVETQRGKCARIQKKSYTHPGSNFTALDECVKSWAACVLKPGLLWFLSMQGYLVRGST